jgi:hypothetical protein
MIGLNNEKHYTDIQRLVLEWNDIKWQDYSGANLLRVSKDIRGDLLCYIAEHRKHEITADSYYYYGHKYHFWLPDVRLSRLTDCTIKISEVLTMLEQDMK